MIIRIAGRGSRSLTPANTNVRPFASSSFRSDNERNIFIEAQAEEEAEAGTRSLLEEQRQRMAQEPIWDGDERLQDTILRMVMDKHQPLRIKGSGSLSQHPADVKMSTIQKPSMLSSPSMGKPSPEATLINVDQISAGLPMPGEDSRRLAKTPHDKPWAAVYVNPMRQEENGEGYLPSIHYGKYLGLPRSSSSRILPKTASGKERLKLAGIKTESLPLDDRNKMKAIREGVRRWDRAGRMRGVKEEAYNYRRAREEEKERKDEYMTEDELEQYLQHDGVLKEGEEMKLTSGSSDSKPGEAQVAMSGGRGFTSVANERIEAAMKTDYFRRNALRGKPLVKDIHAMNPFLKGEERIMNRLIQRQGAAPPWVELNSQVETETTEWRARLIDNWLRRASRIILSSSHLRRGLEPLRVGATSSFEDLHGSLLSPGQRKMLTLVQQYRDAEWEAREKTYHEASLKEVNDIIRKYNVVAPTSVRKGLLLRERELERTFIEARVRLIRRLSEGLDPSASSSTFNVSPSKGKEAVVTGSASFGIRGHAASSASDSSRLGAGLAMGGKGDPEGQSSVHEDPHNLQGRRPYSSKTSYTFQLTSFIKRITHQIVGR